MAAYPSSTKPRLYKPSGHRSTVTRSIAEERIAKLYREAKAAYEDHPERAHRYARLAWSIKQKANTALTAEQKMHYCKDCHSYIPGSALTVRLRSPVLTRTCPWCGAHRRIRYKTN